MFKTLFIKFKNSKIQKFPERERRSGFTLIEMMVVLALIAIISIGSFAAFGNASSAKSVKDALDEMEALLIAARKKSITQENGARWGVHVENTTSTNRLVMFSGATYASGTPSNFYAMKRNIVLTNPVSSSTYDVLFNPITGFLSEKKILTISTLKKDGIIGDIVLNSIGAVTKRYDYGLVGYWHFDEGTGTSTYDASGRANTGTLTNGPTWQPSASCKAGYCLGFDTSATERVLASSPNFAARNTLTLSAWIYPTGVGGTDSFETIILGRYYLSFNDANQALSCYWYGTTPAGYHTTAANSVPLNQWSHVACVWDGTNINEYVNGSLSKTVAVTGSGNPTTDIAIGAESPVRQFQGYIDEVRIYNRALSASEILAMYNDLK